MSDKEKCLEWVGKKCVKWSFEDDKVTATINFGECDPKTKKDIEETLGKNKGFKFKIRE